MGSPMAAIVFSAVAASSLLLPLLAMTTITTMSHDDHPQNTVVIVIDFKFNYGCSGYVFDKSDFRIQCVADLLDTLAKLPGDGEQYRSNHCYGNPIYGYRWVDWTQIKASYCLWYVADTMKNNEVCYHRTGADFVDSANPSICRMRFELHSFTV